jgi:hypothetical protein
MPMLPCDGRHAKGFRTRFDHDTCRRAVPKPLAQRPRRFARFLQNVPSRVAHARLTVPATQVDADVVHGRSPLGSSIRNREPAGHFIPSDLVQTRVRFGYRRLRVLLLREGWEVGKERFYRVYTEEGPAPRGKRPWRHTTAVHR